MSDWSLRGAMASLRLGSNAPSVQQGNEVDNNTSNHTSNDATASNTPAPSSHAANNNAPITTTTPPTSSQPTRAYILIFPAEIRNLIHENLHLQHRNEYGFSYDPQHESHFSISWHGSCPEARVMSEELTWEYDSMTSTTYHILAIQVPRTDDGRIVVNAPTNNSAPEYWRFSHRPTTLELLMVAPEIPPSLSASGDSRIVIPLAQREQEARRLRASLDHIYFVTSGLSDEVHVDHTHVLLFVERVGDLTDVLEAFFASAHATDNRWQRSVVDLVWREGGGIPQDGSMRGVRVLARVMIRELEGFEGEGEG